MEPVSCLGAGPYTGVAPAGGGCVRPHCGLTPWTVASGQWEPQAWRPSHPRRNATQPAVARRSLWRRGWTRRCAGLKTVHGDRGCAVLAAMEGPQRATRACRQRWKAHSVPRERAGSDGRPTACHESVLAAMEGPQRATRACWQRWKAHSVPRERGGSDGRPTACHESVPRAGRQWNTRTHR
jgi:hypothetical protein